MELKNIIKFKFSMILAIATFLALPLFASAQAANEKSDFYSQRDAAAFASRHPGGVNGAFGDGSVRFVSRSVNVEVWRIYLPDSPLEYDFVDARDSNAENKARALFDAAYRLRRAVVVTVPEGGLAAGRISSAEFLVSDGGDSRILAIELRDVIVSSWQTGGSDAGAIPSENLSINFAQVKVNYKSRD